MPVLPELRPTPGEAELSRRSASPPTASSSSTLQPLHGNEDEGKMRTKDEDQTEGEASPKNNENEETKSLQKEIAVPVKDDNPNIPLHKPSANSKQSESSSIPQRTGRASSLEESDTSSLEISPENERKLFDSSERESPAEESSDDVAARKVIEIPVHQEIPSSLKAPNPIEKKKGSRIDHGSSLPLSSELKEARKADKPHSSKPRNHKTISGNVLKILLHGSSDEEEEASKLTNRPLENESLNKNEMISYEQSVVDEGDGLIQALSSSPESSGLSTAERPLQTSDGTTIKTSISSQVPSESSVIEPHLSHPSNDEEASRADRNRNESIITLHELKTIQRIYELSNNKPEDIAESGAKKVGSSNKIKKSKKRIFLKVPNENAVYVPLHGSSDEDSFRQTHSNDSPRRGLTDEEEAPNEYGILVPLHDDSPRPESESMDELVITSQPSVATAAFSALFGAFTPLAQESEATTEENKANQGEDAPKESKTPDDELGKSPESRRSSKKKRRIFKKVPNEDAVYIPLHSSSDEDWKGGEDSSGHSEREQDSDQTNNYSVFVPLNDKKQKDQGNMSPGEDFAVHHPAVASATFNSFFIGVAPLGQSEPMSRHKSGDLSVEKQAGNIRKEAANKSTEEPPRETLEEKDENGNSEIYLASKPALVAAAYTALSSAFSPLCEEENKKSDDETIDVAHEGDKSNKTNQAKDSKMKAYKKLPNQDAVYIPLNSSSEEEERLAELSPTSPVQVAEEHEPSVPLEEPNRELECKDKNEEVESVTPETLPGETFAREHPALASAALDSFFIAVSPLTQTEPSKDTAGIEKEEISDDKDSLAQDIHEAFSKLEETDQEEENDTQDPDLLSEEIKETAKKQKRVAFSQNLTESEDYFAESHPVIASAAFTSMFSAFSALGSQEDAENLEEGGEDHEKTSVKRNSPKKNKQKKKEIVGQPSVATAAYSALYSALSPLGSHDEDGEEEDKGEEDKEKSNKEVEYKKHRKRIFRKVPNENAVFIPLHSSSEEDLIGGEGETEQEQGESGELDSSDEPNKYSVYVPLHDESHKNKSKKHRGKEDKNGNISTEKPSVASAAFSAMFSALSPIGEIELVPLEEDGQPKSSEEDGKMAKTKTKIFKKVPNESNAYFVPLHGSSDEEGSGRNEEEIIEKNERTNEDINKALTEESLGTISDAGIEIENKKSETKPLIDEPSKKIESENVIISHPTVATVAFTALYSASITPAQKNEETDSKNSENKVKYDNETSGSQEIKKDNDTSAKAPTNEQEKSEEKQEPILENQCSEPVHKLDTSKPAIGTAACTSLFTAFSTLGEKEAKQEQSNGGSIKNVKSEEPKTNETQPTTEGDDSKHEASLKAGDSNEIRSHKVEVPLSPEPKSEEINKPTKQKENKDKNRRETKSLEKEGVTKKTVATAAFTALFSALSPLGSTESMKGPQDSDSPEGQTQQMLDTETIKKRQAAFRKVPDQKDAIFIPLHGSTDEEESAVPEIPIEIQREDPKEEEKSKELKTFKKVAEAKEEGEENFKVNKKFEDEGKEDVELKSLTAQSTVSTVQDDGELVVSRNESGHKDNALKKHLKKKVRIFKKVPNENAVIVPLHSSSEEEKSTAELVDSYDSEGNDAGEQAPNEYALFVPLNGESSSKKSKENKDKNRRETKSLEKEGVTKKTVATAAFTALFSAFSPLGSTESMKGPQDSDSPEGQTQQILDTETIKKRQAAFRKLSNQKDAIFIPLHGSTDTEEPIDEKELKEKKLSKDLGEPREDEKCEEDLNEAQVAKEALAKKEDTLKEATVEKKIQITKDEEEMNDPKDALGKKAETLTEKESTSEKKPQDKKELKVEEKAKEIKELEEKEVVKSEEEKETKENAIVMEVGEVTELKSEKLNKKEVQPKKGKEAEKVTSAKKPQAVVEVKERKKHKEQKIQDKKEPEVGKNKKEERDHKDKEHMKLEKIPAEIEDQTERKAEEELKSEEEVREKSAQDDDSKGAQDETNKSIKPGKSILKNPKNSRETVTIEGGEWQVLERREETAGGHGGEPSKVTARQTEIQAHRFRPARLADIVLGVIKAPPQKGEHEYEPVGVRASSQPELRSRSVDRQPKQQPSPAPATGGGGVRAEEARYEVIQPAQELPSVQVNSAGATEGGYEEIGQPPGEPRRFIKIPDQEAIIVPLHGSSDEEINPDRYLNPALMMSEEEIENFPKQPLPYVTFNTEKKKEKSNEGTFKEKLRNQADHFTTKLKGISKPKIVVHKPKMKLPDRPNFKMPEMPKFKLPERPNIKMPDIPKMKLPDLPNKSKFHLPERPKFLQEKPKFLTERPRFKLPERFTHHEKKPKAPRGKKPNPSSQRRPLRDVVTVSSQSGSSPNLFETLKFKTYPRFFKKKKAPLEKMSSLETESSLPATPPRRPRRFSDQQQDGSWVQTSNRDIKFADEEINLRVERMEEEYEREEHPVQFHEGLEVGVRAVELRTGTRESLTSVASEKGSSGSSSNRRRAGVIEEIDSDEFFVRQKGLSREDVDVSRYLSLEIRDAFRQPKNALASLDNEFYDDDEREERWERRPRAPRRSKSQKSGSGERETRDYQQTLPERPQRRKEPTEELVPKPPRKFRSKSGGRYQKRQSSMPSLSGTEREETREGPAPEPPRRRSRDRSSTHSLNKEARRSDLDLAKGGRASDLDIVQTQMTAQHSGDIHPVAPLRKSRSRGTSLADDDRTSRGADSAILQDDYEEEMPSGAHHTAEEIEDEIQVEEEIEIDEVRPEPGQTHETLNVEEKSTDLPGYATVSKNRKKPPPRPPPPPQHHFDFHNQLDNIRTTGKNIFFTYPRRAIRSLQKPMPQRPARYNTIGPVRPPRRNRVFRKPVYMTGETPSQHETSIDKERDLQSGDIVSRMKDRPLPAPPRPPRKSKDYETLDSVHTESSPTETIIAAEIDTTRDEPEVKESRASYLKSKKDEFLKTISKYSPFDKKREEHEEEAKEQTTTSQQTSFDFGEVSVSIQTDPLPKDVIVIDQEIEETEEILIVPDNRSEDKETKGEKYETDSSTKNRSPSGMKKRKSEESFQKTNAEERSEDSIFQQALERVEAARGVLKEARERVTPGSTNSLDDKKSTDNSDRLHHSILKRESLPTSSRSVEQEKEETPPPLPARPMHTKPIPVSFPEKLHLSELDVDKLNVSEIQANKIKVSEIESTCIEVTELTSRGGNLTLNGIELPPDFISNVVAQVTSQVQSQVSQSRSGRELTPQRQERRLVTPPPAIIVQASPEAVIHPEPSAPLTEPTERIPSPRTTRSKGRKSPTRVIDDSEDELATILPKRRDKEREAKGGSVERKTEDPPVETPRQLLHSGGPGLGQASSFQLMGQLFRIWHSQVLAGAGSFAEGVNALFPEGEKRRDAQIAAVILLILITGLILVGFGFDNSVHHHHWDYLPPR